MKSMQFSRSVVLADYIDRRSRVTVVAMAVHEVGETVVFMLVGGIISNSSSNPQKSRHIFRTEFAKIRKQLKFVVQICLIFVMNVLKIPRNHRPPPLPL